MLKSEVTEMLTYLHADHHLEVKPEKVAVWHDALANTEKEAAWMVARQLAQSCRYVPKLADFMQVVHETREATSENWGDAWNRVIDAISRFGWYNAAKAMASISPEAADAIGGASGFQELCHCDSESLPTQRAQFRQRFEANAKRGKVVNRFEAVKNRNALPKPAGQVAAGIIALPQRGAK